MTQIIRRSLRARRPTCFNTGDIVELKTSNGEICTGTLTYKLSEEDDIRKSKWIVTLNGSNRKSTKDLELQEKEILRLVERRLGSAPAPSFEPASASGGPDSKKRK